MDDRRRMPSLVIPFAVLGSAVGWICARLIASPLLGALWPGLRPDASLFAGMAYALFAGVAAAFVAVIAERYCGPDAARLAPWTTRLRFGFLVMAAGVGVGAVGRTTELGVLAGLGGAAAFLPLGALVLGASRRAARARLGSIVAGTDRRAIQVLLAATLAVASVASAMDRPAAAQGRVPPLSAIAMAVAAAGAAAILVLTLVDLLALGKLARAGAAARTMAVCDRADTLGDVPQVDLGLGHAVRARVERGGAAYRSRDRAVELVVGSPRRARAAVIHAIGRGAFALAVAAGAIAVHVVAGGPRGSLTLRTLLCDAGDRWQCGAAHLERDCDGGDGASCRVLAGLLESDGAPELAPDRAIALFARGCDLGDDASCRVLPDPAVRGAVAACMRGARVACAAAAASFEDAGEPERASYFGERAR
jgi:hypothetical protein